MAKATQLISGECATLLPGEPVRWPSLGAGGRAYCSPQLCKTAPLVQPEPMPSAQEQSGRGSVIPRHYFAQSLFILG